MNSLFALLLVSLAPLFAGGQWLNATAAPAVDSKVVIVDVFTFDCINCKHVVPALRSLYKNTSRRDLEIVGVHAPETPFERNRTNVINNLAAQGIVWPVALDNDFRLWHAFDVEYWPTQLVFDRSGKLRATIVGEGQDDQLRAVVARLIAVRR